MRALTSDDPTRAAPYAVGDEVRWRTGPCDFVWHLGRVTSIVDDRPNDGIDKPFWIVRVDTAGERRFSGPVIQTCLRREYPADDSLRSSAAATASGLCKAVIAVPGVNAVTVVEYDRGEVEVFADGGDPDAIARCIYDNTWPGVVLRGQETGDIGNGTRVAFSRGAASRHPGTGGIVRITFVER